MVGWAQSGISSTCYWYSWKSLPSSGFPPAGLVVSGSYPVCEYFVWSRGMRFCGDLCSWGLAATLLCPSLHLSVFKAFALSELIHCLEGDKKIGLLHDLI